jgi:hypothetical protein
MATNEQDLRLKLFNALLTTPHRDLSSIYPVHQEIITQDPRFYVRLAAWYADEGEVRDHKEMFVANLVLSDFPGHRDVGLALLREMPPYQVARVLDFVKGRTVKRRAKRDGREATPDREAVGRRQVGRVLAFVRGEAQRGEAEQHAEFETVTEKRGLFRNVPRSMRTEIERYLREREADPDWFDGSVLHARKAIKRLYASLHIAPSARAQAILFDGNPPPDSRLYALKQIAAAQTPAEQARAIVEFKIPYRVAASVIDRMTPTVLVALIDRMSPQELINNLASLKRHGAFDNSDVAALIDGKLDQAKTDKRVSAYKAQRAAEAAGVSQETVQRLEQVTEAQVRAKGTIVRPTALLIDKSGSMAEAIEIGKRIGAMIAGICEAELYVYAFDTMAYPVEVPPKRGRLGSVGRLLSKRQVTEAEHAEPSLADWERALAGIRAGGNTSCGVALEWMRRKRILVEQIVMVTDEAENTNPRFVTVLEQYRRELKADPHVVFVKTRRAVDHLERECQAARITFDAYQFAGDYYALPNLLPLLTRPSKMDLLMEVLEYPLPVRKSA